MKKMQLSAYVVAGLSLLISACAVTENPSSSNPASQTTSNNPSSSSNSTSTDKGELLSISVIRGLTTDYELNSIANLNNVVIAADYPNNLTEEITAANLTFSPTTLATDVVGQFDLFITYLTKTITWTYNVNEYFEIDNVSAPAFVVNYEANKGIQTNERSEFAILNEVYQVGDENPFKFFPTIIAYNSEDDEVAVTQYHSVSIIEQNNSGTFTELTGSNLEAVVAIDEFESTYDFTEAAIGKQFRLTVRPAGEKYMLNSKYRTSFVFDVVSGYNVYSQDDLLAFDNAGGGYWNAYKDDNNLLTQPSKGLIFHNDIVIDQEFLADAFFYQQGDPEVLSTDVDFQRVIGSLRDGVHLYDRVLADGENYSINGNYFTLDYRSLPLVVREILHPNGRIDPEPGRVISHSYVFKVSSAVENNQGNFTMRNLRVIGNANRTEQVEKSGGALFIKFGINVDAASSNNILTQAFTFFTSELATKVVIENTKGYDSFSSLLYNFGTADFQITDSEFIGAGGPVIINDHYAPEPDGTGGNPPGVVVTNSKLESFVSGSENWFSLVSATAAAAQIAGLGQLFPSYGNNSIIRNTTISGQVVPQFNLIGVLKAGNVNGPTSSKVRGSFTIDNGTPLDFESPLMVATSVFPPQMPRFQSSDGQFALFNGVMLVDQNNNPIPPLEMTGTNFFTGDYLNAYYNVGEGDGFMGLVFELVYPTV